MIASVTLVGSCRDIGAAAIESVVGWVDRCLLIDTGAGDGSLGIMVAAAGDKATTSSWEWTGDYAAARNFALDEAERIGATWAVILDPDERLQVEADSLRAHLASTRAGCIALPNAGRTYFKTRIIRLPCPVRFVGPVHEAFEGYRVGREEFPHATFTELEKTPEELRQKHLRDVEALSRYTQTVADDPRWFFYLGNAREALGQLDEAIEAYRSCWALRGWPEEGAWACFRAAQCELSRSNFVAVIDWCTAGLTRFPGMAELPWMAALASWRLGNAADAVAWARMSESIGCFKGCGRSIERIGFRHPPALYEGPYEILRHGFASLGDADGVRDAHADYLAARELRLSGG